MSSTGSETFDVSVICRAFRLQQNVVILVHSRKRREERIVLTSLDSPSYPLVYSGGAPLVDGARRTPAIAAMRLWEKTQWPKAGRGYFAATINIAV